MRIDTKFERQNNKSIRGLIIATITATAGLIAVFGILLGSGSEISSFIKDNIYSQRQSIEDADAVFNTKGLYNYYSIYDMENVVHSKYIKITLGENDDYKVEFLLDDDIEYIIIGTRNTTYDTYIYLIPKYIRERGFDRVRISALRGDGQYSMGNVRLYDDINSEDISGCEIVDFEIKILDVEIQSEYLKAIANHRADAIARLKILPEDTVYYPAKITVEGKTLDTDMRLKGGYSDHVISDKWSFKFMLDDECVWGMNKFAIHRPQSRNGITEYMLHNMYAQDGGFNQGYDFIQVVINGEYWGVYAYEQAVDSILIADSGRPNGVVTGFEREYDNIRTVYDSRYKYPTIICSQLKIFKEQTALSDSTLSEYAQFAIDAYHMALNDAVDISTLIDFDKLARYIAMCEAFKATHGYNNKNLFFYMNPVTNKFEPISHDMLAMYASHISSTYYRENSLLRHVFDYPEFMEKYIGYLKKYVLNYKVFLESNLSEIKKREYLLNLDNCNTFDYINGFDEYHELVLDTINMENSTFMVTRSDIGEYYLNIDPGSVITVDVQRILVDGVEMAVPFNGREKAIKLDATRMAAAKKVQVEYRPIYAPNLETIIRDAVIQLGNQ